MNSESVICAKQKEVELEVRNCQFRIRMLITITSRRYLSFRFSTLSLYQKYLEAQQIVVRYVSAKEKSLGF